MAIELLKLFNEIKENGETNCPLCKKGIIKARSNVPINKQFRFECSVCGEKLTLKVKRN